MPSQLPIFPYLQRAGGVDPAEMFRVFNMGIGYILVVGRDDSMKAIDHLSETGIPAYQIGHIIAGSKGVRLTIPQ